MPGIHWFVLQFMVKFTCVAAVGPNGQIGANNNLPWAPNLLKGDMSFFKLITMCHLTFNSSNEVTHATLAPPMANVVIMGRKTWESIPARFRPLEGRFNVIVSSKGTDGLSEKAVLASSFDEALKLSEDHVSQTGGQVFVVGGSTLYELANSHKDMLGSFLTEVEGEMASGDTFYPWKYVKENFVQENVNDIAYSLIKDSCKNLIYENNVFGEKNYNYRFYFYHK